MRIGRGAEPAWGALRIRRGHEGRAGDNGDGGNLYGGLRPGGAVHALGREVCQGSDKHPEGIVLGLSERRIRSAKGAHQRLKEDNAAHTQENTEYHGKADDGGNGAAAPLLIPAAQLAAGQNGGAGGKYVFY